MHWLVIRAGALGDFIVTTPAIAALRTRASRLTLVCNPRYAEPWTDLADRIIDVASLDALWLFGASAPTERYDAALCYSPELAARCAALGMDPVLHTTPEPSRRACEHFFEPVGAHLGVKASPPKVAVPEEIAAEVQARLPDPCPIVLAPGAGAPSKVWPGFSTLAQVLAEARLPYIWLCGPDDPPRPAAGPILAGLSLSQVAALARSCRCWVGNDSGPSHLAAAAGAPIVTLFGPTDPRIWAPPGARVLPFDAPARTVAVTALLHSGQPDIPVALHGAVE